MIFRCIGPNFKSQKQSITLAIFAMRSKSCNFEECLLLDFCNNMKLHILHCTFISTPFKVRFQIYETLEVIAYVKKREEEDPTPQEFHICDVLGIRFQYSLWRDFKCPAIHGCGFEYKVCRE